MPPVNIARVFCIQERRFDNGSGNNEKGSMLNRAGIALLGFCSFPSKSSRNPVLWVGSLSIAAAIPRLGVPVFNWRSKALHGVAMDSLR